MYFLSKFFCFCFIFYFLAFRTSGLTLILALGVSCVQLLSHAVVSDVAVMDEIAS